MSSAISDVEEAQSYKIQDRITSAVHQLDITHDYRPPTKLREENVFTGVSYSVH